MTPIEYAIKTRLLEHAGVAGMVGDRIAPQGKLKPLVPPAITYLCVSLIQEAVALDEPKGLSRPRIQIDCWGRTELQAAELEEHAFDALQGFRGTVGGRELVGVFRQNVRDQNEPDLNIYRRIADYFARAAA
jgi:hypothetical protein